jgi:hypothetical protein
MNILNICSKDNAASAAVIIAIAAATTGSLFNSKHASAEQTAPVVAQRMDTIVVTGKQSADVTLDAIVVTASRTQKAQG